MQKILTAVFAVAAIACGAFAFQSYTQLAGLEEKLAALTNERDAARAAEKAAAQESADAKAAAASAKENVARLIAERDRAKNEAKKAATIASTTKAAEAAPGTGDEAPKADGKDFMKNISKMFEGEEGKKMLRTQSEMMVKMMYGDLAKELKLSPKDAETVMAMLSERQGVLTTAGMDAMSGGPDASKKIADLKKEQDDRLKAVLGEEGFKQLEGYERSVGDRMMLQQFEMQFNSAGSPLQASQRQDLLAVMKTEREKTPSSPLSQQAGGDPAAGLAALQDGSAVEAWQKNEADYQRRVLESATRTLSPDQINTLKGAFDQQRTMMEFGMKMFKAQSGNGAAQPAAPTLVVPAGK